MADGLFVLAHLAKHLVFDLDQIAGIEKIVILEQDISHGMGIQRATLQKDSLFGIGRLSFVHVDLLMGGIECNAYSAAYRGDVKRNIIFFVVF